VDKVELGKFIYDFLGFPLSVSFHRDSILTYQLGDERYARGDRSSETFPHPIDMIMNNFYF
jgi:hypothetical protein